MLTMVEAANVLGLLAGALLLMAIIASIKLIRGPLMQRTDGSTGTDSAQGVLSRLQSAVDPVERLPCRCHLN